MLTMTIKYTHSPFYLQTCLEEMVMPICGSRIQRVQGSDFPQGGLQITGSPQKSGKKRSHISLAETNTSVQKDAKFST